MPQYKRPRYRYIRAGILDFSGPLSDYRLVSSGNLGGCSDCLRIRLPDDMELEKYACDCYSTTPDTRSLNDIGYDVMVKIDGKWVVRNNFKGMQPRNIYGCMMRSGYHTVPNLGYLTKERYLEWCKEVTKRKHTDEPGKWVHVVTKVPEPPEIGGYTLKEIVFCDRCAHELPNAAYQPVCPNCEAVMTGHLKIETTKE